MSIEAIIMMIVVLSVVWGGFIVTLAIAARQEKSRSIEDELDG